jgi:hypothetical protein
MNFKKVRQFAEDRIVPIALISLVVLAIWGHMGYISDGSQAILEEQGYTNITLQGFQGFGCGDDDTFAMRFSATNPSGRQVKGYVCSGYLKGYTVRFSR